MLSPMNVRQVVSFRKTTEAVRSVQRCLRNIRYSCDLSNSLVQGEQRNDRVRSVIICNLLTTLTLACQLHRFLSIIWDAEQNI